MATNDVLTLAEAYLAINDQTSSTAGTGDHDDRLAQVITAVSDRMDQLVGPIVNRDYTEYHDGGRSCIVPHRTPVSSIGTVTEADGATTTVLTEETFGAVPSDAWLLVENEHYLHDCEVRRRDLGADANFPTGRRNVKLEYTAGRAASTAAVGDRYKEVASQIIHRMWKQHGSVWAQSSDFLANLEDGGGFSYFQAVKPVVTESLSDQLLPPGIG